MLWRERALFPAALICMSAITSGCARSVNARDWKTSILQLVLNGSDPELATDLKESVAVLADSSSDPQELARAYRAAVGSPDTVQHLVNSGHRWTIVAAGPLLDSPDQVVVAKAELDGGVFRIESVYTSTRLRGGGLRRNAPWRPLLTMPIDAALPAGDYQVQVSWQPLESLPSGKALASAYYTAPLFFTVER